MIVFFFSSRRRHTRYWRDWSSDVCSSDLDYSGWLTVANRGEGGSEVVVHLSFGERSVESEMREQTPEDRDPLARSEEHTSELQSRQYLVCRLLLEKK